MLFHHVAVNGVHVVKAGQRSGITLMGDGFGIARQIVGAVFIYVVIITGLCAVAEAIIRIRRNVTTILYIRQATISVIFVIGFTDALIILIYLSTCAVAQQAVGIVNDRITCVFFDHTTKDVIIVVGSVVIRANATYQSVVGVSVGQGVGQCAINIINIHILGLAHVVVGVFGGVAVTVGLTGKRAVLVIIVGLALTKGIGHLDHVGTVVILVRGHRIIHVAAAGCSCGRKAEFGGQTRVDLQQIACIIITVLRIIGIGIVSYGSDQTVHAVVFVFSYTCAGGITGNFIPDTLQDQITVRIILVFRHCIIDCVVILGKRLFHLYQTIERIVSVKSFVTVRIVDDD